MATEKQVLEAYKNMIYHHNRLLDSVYKAEQRKAIGTPGYAEGSIYDLLDKIKQQINDLTKDPIAKAVQETIRRKVYRY